MIVRGFVIASAKCTDYFTVMVLPVSTLPSMLCPMTMSDVMSIYSPLSSWYTFMFLEVIPSSPVSLTPVQPLSST